MIPLYIFLFIYILFMITFLIFTFVNLYHLATTASLTTVSFGFTFFILASAVIVLYFTAGLLVDIDWKQSVFNSSNEAFTDPF